MGEPSIGLDFGTTNSAIAITGPDGRPRLAHFGPSGEAGPTFRSVLYFQRDRAGGPVDVHAGPGAIAGYLDRGDRPGRLIQSLKSFLASRHFVGTQIFGRSWRLETLIAALLAPLRREAEAAFGRPVHKAVVGRPVHFVNARDAEDDALAVARLTAALHNAGFREVQFEYEPVGAAYHYEQDLERDELILIADFGGGTSDFSLLRVGPSYRGASRRADSILGHDGVGLAGDVFDGKMIRHRVAPRLGAGASVRSAFGRDLPVPKWIYGHLERWHHVSFLRSHKNMQVLLDLRREALEPEKLDALIRVVENDLGFLLYRATERAKWALSESESTRFVFEHEVLSLDSEIGRDEFERWIREELDQIEACVARLLARSGVAAATVDRVFLTGGSSFVPAVRDIFARQFGEERLESGAQLTSVASGLSLRGARVAGVG